MKLFVTFLIFLHHSHSLASADKCNLLFSEPTNKTESHQNIAYDLISYLKHLLDQNIISTSNISPLLKALKNDKLINPIPHEKNSLGIYFTKTSFQIHFEAIESYLNDPQLDKTQLLNLLTKIVEHKNGNQAKREDTKTETKVTHQKMQFHKIKPGTFMMGPPEHKVEVTLTKEFEMANIPVTQMQWLLIMGENPSKYKTGNNSIEIEKDGKKIYIQPDNPVEKVSWKDSLNFIQKVNTMSEMQDSTLKSIILEHDSNYEYRLPTEAEWEYVLRNEGKNNDIYPWGSEASKAEEYAWFFENAEEKTHPVAEKKPIISAGHPFYDMMGNVGEILADASNDMHPHPGGVDPIISGNDKSNHITRGGSHFEYLQNLNSHNRFFGLHYSQSPTQGLRLVRVKK